VLTRPHVRGAAAACDETAALLGRPVWPAFLFSCFFFPRRLSESVLLRCVCRRERRKRERADAAQAKYRERDRLAAEEAERKAAADAIAAAEAEEARKKRQWERKASQKERSKLRATCSGAGAGTSLGMFPLHAREASPAPCAPRAQTVAGQEIPGSGEGNTPFPCQVHCRRGR
jgi:hypothetical protein